MLPAINMDMFALNINKDMVDITISGSLVADIVDLFIQVFKGLVLNIIVNTVNSAAPPIITSEVNTLFYNMDGRIVIERLGNLGFDFVYTAPATISDTQVVFYVNGTIFNNSFGVVSPGEGFGDLFIDPASSGEVQLDVSQYSVDSLFVTL